jgi:hypothetical protein
MLEVRHRIGRWLPPHEAAALFSLHPLAADGDCEQIKKISRIFLESQIFPRKFYKIINGVISRGCLAWQTRA